MAIAYSAPLYERRRRRERKSSQALSTHINTTVVFPDLSLKSQVIYLAMLETWRVIKEITQEEVEVVYQEDMEDINSEEEGSLTGYLMEEIMIELEDMENMVNFDEVDTKIRGHNDKPTKEEKNTAASGVLPDLICSPEETLDSWEAKERSSTVDLLPCIVAWCPAGTGLGHSRRAQSGTPCHSDPGHCHYLEMDRQDNFNDSVSVPSTPSTKEDDLWKLDDRLVPTHSPHLMIPGKAAQDESKSSWAQTGRLLARVAEQARDKRRSLDPRKYHGGREEADPVDHGYPLGSQKHRSHVMDPLAEYSNLLSTLGLCGISYLIRK